MDLQILVTIPTDGRPPTATNVTGAATATAAAPLPAPPTVDDWRAETGFPKVATFGTVAVMMVAPTNPAWKPSMSAHMLGQQGAHVADPSYPPGERSPAGFPVNNGRILWYDGMYASDAEVYTAIGQAAAQDQAAIDQALGPKP